MRKRIKTMEEFSEFVGLSRPTVSKYFNDPTSVRPSTRIAIEAALRQSGFRPSILAVNLNRRRSNMLGLIVPDPTDPFYMGLTSRIEVIARDAGFLSFVLSSDGKADMEEEALLTFKSMNIAGVIIAPLGASSRQSNLMEVVKSMPVVFVDSALNDTSSFVGTNNSQSVGLIVDYLCRSGPPPCFFGMPTVNNNAFERQQAYVDAMRRHGAAPMVIDLTPSDSWHFEKFAFDETMRILKGGRRFPSKTVLCANDRIAFGLIGAAYQMGLSVGHQANCDLRVAGHDDHLLARYTCPPLTTVSQDVDLISRTALEILMKRLGGDMGAHSAEGERIFLNAEIMLRGSA
ncbi:MULTISPECIES: LacI family DNA-binding transcriptional regulator [unclassified Mesorhizobium]|uniref:LacI family DNA-binding transcriptional regulator n=1 Tax=unclassified Mesorhizobium TaxID=325217 RepID=UPI00112B33A0|nr:MULTISPECIES: LacI family DNA-binding transcriptional regulator [unclassified Mesorhizobium]TPI22396.1 LacI family transcriptional regulator [Mesorhizobium sp. B4-1-1]TPL33343.1 LacI family transcriptional regulator [Mesorhizobium sp. B2-4-6]